MKTVLSALCLFGFVSTTHATEANQEAADDRRELSAVLRVGGVRDLQNMSPDEQEQAEKRLKRTGVFHRIEFENDHSETKINFKKKWTTIPIFKLRNSGNDSILTLGIYDADAFSSMHELGAQFDKLNQTDSYVVWARLNGLFSWKNKFGFEFWDQARDVQLRNASFSLIESYGLKQKNGVFFFHRIIKERPLLRLGFQSEVIYNKYLQQQFSQESVEVDNPVVPQSGSWAKISVSMSMGEIDEFVPGKEVGSEARAALFVLNNLNEHNCIGLEGAYKSVIEIPRSWYLAAGFRSGYISSCERAFLYSFGGLFDVRAIPESAIVSDLFVINNLELRRLLNDASWTRIQFVLGHDIIIANALPSSASLASSVSAGLRFIFPKIYRLNVRTDISREYQIGVTRLSFGLQQFF